MISRRPSTNGGGEPPTLSGDRLLAALETLAEVLGERVADIVLRRLSDEMPGQAASPDERLLDVSAVAVKLAVPKSAVYKMANSGRPSAVKVGGRLRFRNSDIDRFIAGAMRTDERVQELAAEGRANSGGAARRRRAAGPTGRTRARRNQGEGAPKTTGSSLTLISNPDGPESPASG